MYYGALGQGLYFSVIITTWFWVSQFLGAPYVHNPGMSFALGIPEGFILLLLAWALGRLLERLRGWLASRPGAPPPRTGPEADKARANVLIWTLTLAGSGLLILVGAALKAQGIPIPPPCSFAILPGCLVGMLLGVLVMFKLSGRPSTEDLRDPMPLIGALGDSEISNEHTQ